MLKRTLNICGLLILLSLFVISCNKKINNNLPKDVLTGTWKEITTGYNRVLIFEPGGKITILLKSSQYADWDIKLTGKYVIDDDNLAVTITEQLEKQSSGSIGTKSVNIQWFDKGRFNIKNFVLTINYKTYPADAPVDTETKFNKVIPID